MKNWKTTLAGVAAAAATAITLIVQQGHSVLDWKTWIGPVTIAILGALAGDKK